LAFIFLSTVLPLWLDHNLSFGPLETGIVFFYIGLVSAFSQAILLPWISKKISHAKLVGYGLVLLSIGFLGLGVFPDLALLVLFGSLVPLGFGISYATLTTLISINASLKVQGGSLGVAWALTAAAQAIGPTIAASSFAFGVSIGSSGLAFLVSAALSAVAIPLVLLFRKYRESMIPV
jgi:MFS family permease